MPISLIHIQIFAFWVKSLTFFILEGQVIPQCHTGGIFHDTDHFLGDKSLNQAKIVGSTQTDSTKTCTGIKPINSNVKKWTCVFTQGQIRHRYLSVEGRRHD